MKRDDPRAFRFAERAIPEIEGGQSLLAIERFSLTANNITYAILGDPMVYPASGSSEARTLPSYWGFFPTEDGWGLIPVWGFATVTESRADSLAIGTRVYGYLPPASHLVVEPGAAGRWGFLDSAAHRAELPAVYNAYLLPESDPLHHPRFEDHLALLRTLFVTSFLIDDYLEENGFFGAEAIVLSSASSKTALAAAFLLAQRDDIAVVGLTSERNLSFVEESGVYDRVSEYGEVPSNAPAPAAYVDFSGNSRVRSAVHSHYGRQLRHSLSVGLAHWDRVGEQTGAKQFLDSQDLPGPQPEFFFAGDRIVKRTADWGARGLWGRIAEAWHPFVEWTDDWLEISRGSGPKAIERAYLDLIEGPVNPAIGHVLTPNGRS